MPGDVDRAVRAEALCEAQPHPVAIEDQDVGAPHPAQEQMQYPHGPGSKDRNRIAGPDASPLYRMDAAGKRLGQRRFLGRDRSEVAENMFGGNAQELCEAAADQLISAAASGIAPVAQLAVPADATGAPAAAFDGIQHDVIADLDAAIVVRGIDHRPRDLVASDHRKGNCDVAREYPAFGGADRNGP